MKKASNAHHVNTTEVGKFCPNCGMHLFDGKCVNCGFGDSGKKSEKKGSKQGSIT